MVGANDLAEVLSRIVENAGPFVCDALPTMVQSLIPLELMPVCVANDGRCSENRLTNCSPSTKRRDLDRVAKHHDLRRPSNPFDICRAL
jgi:hypothetical protein